MTDQATIAAVIVAAGRGTRAGGATPKQWRPLFGLRVLDHCLAAFANHPRIDAIALVLGRDALAEAPAGVIAVEGGATRAASVRAGLEALETRRPDFVLIHDVARPCVSATTIEAVCAKLSECVGAAPALPVSDALWTGAQDRVTGTQDRAGLYRAQTPQGFWFAPILEAHRKIGHADPAADDVAVARAAGLDVAIVPGDEDNLKITYPADFERAERILEARLGYPVRQRL